MLTIRPVTFCPLTECGLGAGHGAPEALDFERMRIRDLEMHPNGSVLAFTAGNSVDEVWVMEDFLPESPGR